jgi:5'-AMP-activated protein kinase, catalytic alpha subunit
MEKSKDPEVIMGGLLGSGSFAKVYKAHKVDTSEAVATKVFDKDVVWHGRAGEARTDWGSFTETWPPVHRRVCRVSFVRLIELVLVAVR